MAIYAGIGSRETPQYIINLMHAAARKLALRGFRLASGGATGADTAFHQGQSDALGASTIYLPWRGYNNVQRDQLTTVYTGPSDKALGIARAFHPVWDTLSQGAQKLHGRNTHIVLGHDCESPVDMILCWTEKGEVKGGTGQALRIAEHYKIPVFNFGMPGGYQAVLNEIAAHLEATA